MGPSAAWFYEGQLRPLPKLELDIAIPHGEGMRPLPNYFGHLLLKRLQSEI